VSISILEPTPGPPDSVSPNIPKTRSFTKIRNDVRSALKDSVETFNILQGVDRLIDTRFPSVSTVPPAPFSTPESSFNLDHFSSTPQRRLSSPRPSFSPHFASPLSFPPLDVVVPVSPSALVSSPLPSLTPSSVSSVSLSSSPPSPPSPPLVVMAAPKFYMPTISSSDSPKFVVTPQGFKTFFFDVKNLASRAGLNAEDTIEWACLYAGEEGARWESLECMKDPANPPTLKDFKDAVFARYPSLANDQRYSMDDLRRIQSMFRDRATMTVAELATYTQDFSDCSEWLISKGKLWALERSDAFIAGLPVPVENFTRLRRVAMGLIKDPVSGWKYDEICKAALLVVSSDLADSPPVPDAYVQPVALGNRASYPLPPSHFPPSGQSPPIYGYIAVSDVNRVMGQGAAPPSRQSQFAPQAPPPGGGLNNPPPPVGPPRPWRPPEPSELSSKPSASRQRPAASSPVTQ
jgi:hypothetical protein